MTTVMTYPNVIATGAGPRLEKMTNLASNPRAALTTAGYILGAGTGGAATPSRSLLGGPLPESPSYFRGTWTAAQTGNASAPQIASVADGLNLVTGGRTYVARCYVRASWAAVLRPLLAYYAGATFLTGGEAPYQTLTPGQWTPLTVEIAAPASATRAQITVSPIGSSPLAPIGATLDVSAYLLYEKLPGVPEVTSYGDGDSPGWTWLGAPHASQSSGYGAIIP